MGACSAKPRLPNDKQLDLSHFEELRTMGKGGFGKVTAVFQRDPISGKSDKTKLYAMKRQEKHRIVKDKRFLESVWAERRILSQVKSPFLLYLVYAFQSPVEVFLVMPLMEGGDLRWHMSQAAQPWPEDTVKFYVAEMLVGLAELHRLDVVYRDLKPDNALLGAKGHARLSDFGLSVMLTANKQFQTKGKSGTVPYMAPEMIAHERYGVEVDLWALAVTAYEMLHWKLPFKVAQEDSKAFQKPVNPKAGLSPECCSFLKQCLDPDLTKRLGRGRQGYTEVQKHPWFASLDLEQLRECKIEPPLKVITGQANCSPDAELANQFLDDKPKPIAVELQTQFEGFEYNTDLHAAVDTAEHEWKTNNQ